MLGMLDGAILVYIVSLTNAVADVNCYYKNAYANLLGFVEYLNINATVTYAVGFH